MRATSAALAGQLRPHTAHADLVATVADADCYEAASPARTAGGLFAVRRAPCCAAGAPAEHLVERAVPLGHRDAAHVQVVAGAAAARPLDRQQVGRPLRAPARRRARRRRPGSDRRRTARPSALQRRLERAAASRRRSRSGPARRGGAARGPARRRRAGRRSPACPRPTSEAGDDQTRAPRRSARGPPPAARARREECRDAPPAGIEGEQM